ncbi:MAG: hypothetical protein KBT00_01905 [Bacteroidales bacterium]|nr:hypothetical protein [Candidatus Cacconaster merdequi]
MRKLSLALLLAFICPASAMAEIGKPSSISVGGSYCYVTNTENLRDGFLARNGHPSYTVQFGYNTFPGCRSSAYAERYNFPVIGFGLTFDNCSRMQFKNNSSIGDFVNVYAFMNGAFYKERRFSLGYLMNMGMGITGVLYDPIDNPYQFHIGSPLSIYLSFGPQIKLRPSDNIEIDLNAYWYHHSNGNMWMSNVGLNGLSAGAALRYNFEEPYTRQVRRLEEKADFPKGFFYEIYGSYGLHACKTEFLAFNKMVEDPALKQRSFTSRPRIGLGFDAMYRYSLLCATGIVLDCNYNWDGGMLKRSDTVIYGEDAVRNGPGYSPLNIALGFLHEFYYGNLSGFMGCSAYLYRKVGINEDFSRFYQRIGFRFHFPSWCNSFAGWCIRSSLFKDADFFEFQVGIRI